MSDPKRFRLTLDVTLDDEEYRAIHGDPDKPGRVEAAAAEVEARIRGMIAMAGIADEDFCESWNLSTEILIPEPTAEWVVIHCPNGGNLSEFGCIEANSLLFAEPVDREQAVADAEHTYGEDFGSVLSLVRSNDPDAALDAYVAAMEQDTDPAPGF